MSVIYESVNSGEERIPIDPGAPWASWNDPTLTEGTLRDVAVDLDRNLRRRDTDELIGSLTEEGLQQLGWHASFPADFVQKLPADLQSQVINDRLAAATPKEFTFVADGGHFTNIAPGWRELVPYRETAQHVLNTLRNVYGDVEVAVAEANGKARVRIDLPLQASITAKKGDVLRAGVEVEQVYGITTAVALHATRLTCLNGMTATGEEFKWTQRNAGSRAHQLAWLDHGLASVTANFDNLVRRAQLMATIEVTANPVDVLREHARAMRLPSRFLPGLVAAFNEEPGATEWDLLNAFTRFATHGNLPQRVAHGVARASGDWVSDFDMVRCRLPRPLATHLGVAIEEVAT